MFPSGLTWSSTRVCGLFLPPISDPMVAVRARSRILDTASVPWSCRCVRAFWLLYCWSDPVPLLANKRNAVTARSGLPHHLVPSTDLIFSFIFAFFHTDAPDHLHRTAGFASLLFLAPSSAKVEEPPGPNCASPQSSFPCLHIGSPCAKGPK